MSDSDVKVTDLPALSSADSADVLIIVDVDADVTKKITTQDLLAGLSGGGGGVDSATVLSIVTSADLDMNGNRVLFGNVYSNEVDLPSASSYHGMFAHVHSTGAAYFAHAGNWIKLANESSVPTSLTDLSISDGTTGQVLTTDGLGAFSFTTIDVPTSLTDLSISDGTTGQVLTTDGLGAFSFTTISTGSVLTNIADSADGVVVSGPLKIGDMVITSDGDPAGNTVMRSDSSGNLGIAVPDASPIASQLEVRGTGVTTTHLETTQTVVFNNLPSSDPVVAGQLWNDAGTLKISAG